MKPQWQKIKLHFTLNMLSPQWNKAVAASPNLTEIKPFGQEKLLGVL